MQSYLEQLDPAQREAVLNTDGPALVIAGAGSGKTRVLTMRVARLLANGVHPGSILALTFTNKAAREMKERIGLIVGEDVTRKLWMGTFHSIFARVLRSEAQAIGYSSHFTIYDTVDSKSLVKSILKEMKLPEKEYRPGEILSRISSAKNDLLLPAAYARDQHRQASDKAARLPLVGEIYYRYVKACVKAGAMDFDDLLMNTNILFRDNPGVLEKYQDYFKYILVDEYQDTNFSQYLILRKLAGKHDNLCVVGDDAQSIYSFRGARIENILNFRNDYPGYKLFRIERNYRSTQNIVNAANSIIANNQGQIKKTVYSENEVGEKVRVLYAYSDIEEGILVVKDLISRMKSGEQSLSDFAILYRANSQSRIFEEALRKQNIPYKIYGGLSFYQRKEIKDLLAYLRLAINPKDGEALKRVINYPARGIGDTTLEKLAAVATANEISIWEVINYPLLSTIGFNAGTVKKLAAFASLINGLGQVALEFDAYEATREIAVRSGLMNELYQDKSIEGQARVENIEEMISGARLFTEESREAGHGISLPHFLENVSLLTDMDNEADDDISKVTLMTIHSAKGLEYSNVYIVGVEEGMFPSPFAVGSNQAIEEERRLFYVAVTRAGKSVTISYARSRFKYGDHCFVNPSRFIQDIDKNLIEVAGLPGQFNTGRPPDKPLASKLPPILKVNSNRLGGYVKRPSGGFTNNQNPEPFITNHGNLKIGSMVEHERFGFGQVLSLSGFAPDVKATILFKVSGEKQLLLKFAKLKILE